ncbi:ribosomal protein L7Ae/L30e/S12e/Gadd45 family protein [Artemisia annua]|uniref:Ribosomal protein L7Ae/L30e/S12e/Gadd45 family protein n=1 Tax=Artemisia annua TaxID=35608 RepID=A0A2U1PFF5_ARTAN|nr:ribosomal protein L7Ae/L30e/S12e/Gadd45 family protein [Artemisia annua]
MAEGSEKAPIRPRWQDMSCWQKSLESTRYWCLKFATKKRTEKVVNPLFEKRPKQFGISRALPPSKDLHRSGSR